MGFITTASKSHYSCENSCKSLQSPSKVPKLVKPGSSGDMYCVLVLHELPALHL